MRPCKEDTERDWIFVAKGVEINWKDQVVVRVNKEGEHVERWISPEIKVDKS